MTFDPPWTGPATDHLIWVASDGEWTLRRTLYRLRCDWELVNPDGEVVGEGMSTTGGKTAIVRANATRKGRRLFHKLTKDES